MPSSSTRRKIGASIVAALLILTTIAVPAEAKVKKDKKAKSVPVELVVKVRWGSDPEEVARDLGARVIETLIGSRRVVLIEVDDTDPKKAAKRLAEDSRIIWAEQNYVGSAPEAEHFHAWPSETRPRAATRAQWIDQDAVSSLDLVAAHQISTGEGVTIAILDTGVDVSHPDLAGFVKRRADLIDGDFRPDDVGNGLDDDGDGLIDEAVGHGTHIAGILRLVAPDAELLAYRVLDSDGQGTVWGVAEAIRHAVDSGADVINLSFGTSKKIESKVLKDAIKYAAQNDVIIVAAAGNDGSGKKRYPAAESAVLAVGAYNAQTTEAARFASHGKWVTVAAPGVDIASTVPGGGYATWSGSSMAAPFVAGQVALLIEANPNLSAKQLTDLVKRNTWKLKGKKGTEAMDLFASLN
ncbi:S8 family serine peptidase [Acidimicrobiaceae bacterium AH-315-P05]|nr:S8 family serine peptidase [Acidimicrobiaceae bacterium AH-315-P05]